MTTIAFVRPANNNTTGDNNSNNAKAEISPDKSKLATAALVGGIISGLFSLGSGYISFTEKNDVKRKETYTFVFLLLSTLTLMLLVMGIPDQTSQLDKGSDSIAVIMAIISAILTFLYGVYVAFIKN